MDYWWGIIIGCACAATLFMILMFSDVEQNKALQAQVKELTEKVEEHEKIMRAYEFYNWQYSLKMENDK